MSKSTNRCMRSQGGACPNWHAPDRDHTQGMAHAKNAMHTQGAPHIPSNHHACPGRSECYTCLRMCSAHLQGMLRAPTRARAPGACSNRCAPEAQHTAETHRTCLVLTMHAQNAASTARACKCAPHTCKGCCALLQGHESPVPAQTGMRPRGVEPEAWCSRHDVRQRFCALEKRTAHAQYLPCTPRTQ